MQLPILFSLIYFITFMIHGGFGAYMFYRDPKSPLNRVFFALCISLAIWAFSFSVAINAPDQAFCLFWRRIASIGVSAYYCFMLHFVILLTNHPWFIKHKKVLPLLYLPAILFIWVYSLSAEIAPGQYELLHTNIGWIKISLSTFWDYLYNAYFLLYMLLFVKIIWDWYFTSDKASDKFQAKLILSTFGLVFLLVMGTFQYRLQNNSTPFPEIACVIALIPIFSCYYSMKKYQLMTDKQLLDPNDSDLILMGHHREKVFLYLSSFLMFGGCLYYISQYLFKGENFNQVFQFSLSFILIGFLLKSSQSFISSVKIREYIAIGFITLMIPLLTLKFLDVSSITIWSMSLIFILMSVVFNNRWIIGVVAFSSVITQLIVWLRIPRNYVLIDNSDHIVRLGFIGFAIILAYCINQLYTLRLKELTRKVHFQTFLSDISFELVSVNQYNFSEKMMHMLKLSGKELNSDRCSLYLFNDLTEEFSIIQEWCKPGIHSELADVQNISYQEMPWLISKLQNKESLCIESLDDLPPEAALDRENLNLKSIKSFTAIPIVNGDKVLGFITLSSLSDKNQWTIYHISHLDILANLVADALGKIEAEKEIERMAYYDELTGLPNRILFNDRLSQAIKLSNRTETHIGVMFLDLDLFKSVNDTIGMTAAINSLKMLPLAFPVPFENLIPFQDLAVMNS